MQEPDLFPAQDSVLSSQGIVDRLLPLYDMTPPYSCRFFRKGICDTYSIHAGDQRYFMKVYRAGRRSFLDVSEEVRLLNHLLEQGVSAVKPVPRMDGRFVNELKAPEGVRYSVLFNAVDGQEEVSDQNRRDFGVMVARMHEAADTMAGPYQRQPLDTGTLIDENMQAIEPLMKHRIEDLRLIRSIGDDVAGRVTSLLAKNPPEYGICHGDLHGGDVFYGPDGVPTLLDFDSSGTGWRAVDIGVYLCHEWMDTGDEMETERQNRLSVFIDGYSTVRKLSSNELQVIRLTPAIRHIFLMGHVLRNTTVYEGWNWANDGFIDWHMAWFKHWDGHQKEMPA